MKVKLLVFCRVTCLETDLFLFFSPEAQVMCQKRTKRGCWKLPQSLGLRSLQVCAAYACVLSGFVCLERRRREVEADRGKKDWAHSNQSLHLSVWIININLLIYHQPINLDLQSRTQALFALSDSLIVWLDGCEEICNEWKWSGEGGYGGKIFWLGTNEREIDGAIEGCTCFIYPQF